MAIDSAMKRFSMLNMAGGVVYPRLFQPDGAVDADDRAFLLRIYGGNALSVAGDVLSFGIRVATPIRGLVAATPIRGLVASEFK